MALLNNFLLWAQSTDITLPSNSFPFKSLISLCPIFFLANSTNPNPLFLYLASSHGSFISLISPVFAKSFINFFSVMPNGRLRIQSLPPCLPSFFIYIYKKFGIKKRKLTQFNFSLWTTLPLKRSIKEIMPLYYTQEWLNLHFSFRITYRVYRYNTDFTKFQYIISNNMIFLKMVNIKLLRMRYPI